MSTRDHLHISHRFGDKASDVVVGTMGSWRFIIIQTAIVLLWIIFNVWLLSRPFDPFPFILLNLAFSTQAAYSSPLILMSQNRQAMRDRGRDDLESSEVSQMLSINQQQLSILHTQDEILQLLRDAVKP
jgi:uncharacterized membrane protein